MKGRGRSTPRRGSSAILQLCAEDNIQVCNLTTRGQLFPRAAPPDPPQLPQAARHHDAEIAAARAKEVMSQLAEMGPGTSFHRVIDETEPLVARRQGPPRRAVHRQGLFRPARRRAREQQDQRRRARPARAALSVPVDSAGQGDRQRYRNAEVVWCQEEPQNMGAWSFVDRRIEQVLVGLDVTAKRPRFAGRPEAASPATGLFEAAQCRAGASSSPKQSRSA